MLARARVWFLWWVLALVRVAPRALSMDGVEKGPEGFVDVDTECVRLVLMRFLGRGASARRRGRARLLGCSRWWWCPRSRSARARGGRPAQSAERRAQGRLPSAFLPPVARAPARSRWKDVWRRRAGTGTAMSTQWRPKRRRTEFSDRVQTAAPATRARRGGLRAAAAAAPSRDRPSPPPPTPARLGRQRARLSAREWTS